MLNKKLKTIFALGFSLAAMSSLVAEDVSTADKEPEVNVLTVEEYKHEGQKYPMVLFQTNIEDKEYYNRLTGYEAFDALDKESVGLPIGVRVLKGVYNKGDATSITSVLVSASLLGLVPVVSSQEFKVRYDVFVQGESIADFQYSMSSKDVENFWAGPANSERDLKPQEALFLDKTIDQFFADLRNEEDVQAVFKEYREYFDDL